MQIVRGGFVLRFCLSSAFDYPARAMAKGRLNSERIWFRRIDAENTPAFIGNAVETFSGDAVAGSLANVFPREWPQYSATPWSRLGRPERIPHCANVITRSLLARLALSRLGRKNGIPGGTFRRSNLRSSNPVRSANLSRFACVEISKISRIDDEKA
jgi:hypothetical protein